MNLQGERDKTARVVARDRLGPFSAARTFSWGPTAKVGIGGRIWPECPDVWVPWKVHKGSGIRFHNQMLNGVLAAAQNRTDVGVNP